MNETLRVDVKQMAYLMYQQGLFNQEQYKKLTTLINQAPIEKVERCLVELEEWLKGS